MMFTTPLFNESIQTEEGEIPVLVVENKTLYQTMILDFLAESNGIESEHYFYLENKEIDLHKRLETMTDFFNLDINRTKNITKLHQYIKKEHSNEEQFMETLDLTNKINAYIQTIANSSDYHLTFDDDFDVQSLFKMVGLRFYYEDSTLLSRLIDYIKLTRDFFGKQIFVLVGLKTIFSISELEDFYKFARYNKVNIFLLESELPKEKLDGEKYRIIDEDLCVIY